MIQPTGISFNARIQNPHKKPASFCENLAPHTGIEAQPGVKFTSYTLPRNFTAAELAGMLQVKSASEPVRDKLPEAKMVNARHILLQTEQEAIKVKQEIDAGKSFTAAALEYSMCPSKQNGGDLGNFGKGEMVPEFWQAASTLPVGKVSDPVKTDFGYHLIEVLERK